MIYPVPDGVNWNMRTMSTLVKLQKFCGLLIFSPTRLLCRRSQGETLNLQIDVCFSPHPLS